MADSEAATRAQGHLRMLLPAAATLAFVAMVAAGESQVRSSPQWPPPARHELGGWEIKEPPILNWAAYLNLPASLPIVWAWTNVDSIGEALDDHELWIYIPWVILVWCLWYLVGCHVDRLISREPWRSRREFTAVVSAQVLFTIEIAWYMIGREAKMQTTAERALVWAWLLCVALGWVHAVARAKWLRALRLRPLQ